MPEQEVQALLEEIRGQSEAERQRILEEGRGRVSAIRARAEEQIRRLEAEAERQLERRLSVDEDRLRGEARLESRTRVLSARREWLDRAFQAARSRLAERCSSAEYGELLPRLAREAAAAVGRQGILRVAQDDLELARKAVSESGLDFEVRGEAGQKGTLIAMSRDGLRRADNGILTRLEQTARSREQEIALLLFGGPQP
jgi:vacuolar-type H+-ATPase subunit E/Vma4